MRDYVRGRRLPYSNPAKYALVASTIYVGLINAIDLDRRAPVIDIATAIFGSGMIRSRLLTLLPYLMFLVLVPVAGLLRALNRRSTDWNTAECYVFLVLVQAQVFLLHGVLLSLGVFDTTAGTAVAHAAEVAFLGWGLRGFLRTTVPQALAAAVLLFVAGRLLFGATMWAAVWLSPVLFAIL